MDLETSVSELRGVGEARGKKLEKLGILNIGDLLAHFPKDYEDRREIFEIETAPLGEKSCIKATVIDKPRRSIVRSGLDLTKLRANDGKMMLNIAIFNQPYAQHALHAGVEYVFYGTLQQNDYGYNMSNPIFEKVGERTFTGCIVPLYHLTAGISNLLLSVMMREALNGCGLLVEETLPAHLGEKLADVPFAYENIHFPQSEEALEQARERLSFEELFFLSVGLFLLKDRREDGTGVVIPKIEIQEFPLPFSPTGAQVRVMEEIANDLASGQGMNRLVQGDVGSGKTAVAAYAAFLAVKAGYQVAMMVPTEVLSHQHFRSLSSFLEPLGVRVGELTASLTAKEKREVKKKLEEGQLDFVIGTHALISKDVAFSKLALVIADEQHRFGVDQRAKLSAKSDLSPHVLVMSATPIPRTLALMIYGDLEVSVIDELPPGRTEIETYVAGEHKRKGLYGFIEKQVAEGRQVYIVCPAVGETEPSGEMSTSELKAVTVYVEELRQWIFPQLRIEFLHGKRKAKEKEEVMGAFSRGEWDILVSTTVIEVGVDVPNANLIVIENADRFGLSQLHQLRGRVGRGKHKSFCVLMTSTTNEQTRHRLKTLASTTDGFKISEEDLKIRGPGDFFGSRQHGLPNLKLADLSGDMRTLSAAQNCANALMSEDPTLAKEENQGVRRRASQLFSGTADIFN
ncbi:MAG: ATP-dependent DNA helicase RecG [Eubacteriales bacterium]